MYYLIVLKKLHYSQILNYTRHNYAVSNNISLELDPAWTVFTFHHDWIISVQYLVYPEFAIMCITYLYIMGIGIIILLYLSYLLALWILDVSEFPFTHS